MGLGVPTGKGLLISFKRQAHRLKIPVFYFIHIGVTNSQFGLQVISKKDQAQYWYPTEQSHIYIPVDMFSTKFKESSFGKKLEQELSEPYNISESHEKAISSNVYSLSKWELLRACMSRELLLMKRNYFIYIFKSSQVMICDFTI